MTSTTTRQKALREAIAAERRELAEVLAGLPARAWDEPTLCAGWRVREVVAHMTMPFRYSIERFEEEMAKSAGDFTASRHPDRRRQQQRSSHAAGRIAGGRQQVSHAVVPPASGATAGIPRCRDGDSN